MHQEEFAKLIGDLTVNFAGRPLNAALEADLNRRFGADSAEFGAVRDACREAIAAGWMCNRQAGGIRYGRVLKPGPRTHGYSVDVVEMADIAGPHHRHPNGEIDMVMPLTPTATFDSRSAGWLVYGPDTAHRPTVAGGNALILYLLPDGAIEFTSS